jgi:L-threonylcarbamoyladenylate synthase
MAPPVPTRIRQATPGNLAFLARRLCAGEIVAVPTETVYGLAGNALDPAACARIFRAKGRPVSDPLIVHLHSAAQLPLVCRPNAAALKLARRFWPGPLTLILPKIDAVPAIVTAGRDSVAVRVPRHPVFRQLLKLTKLPLAAPSANPFGYISPTTARHVRDGLNGKIRHILDGGPAAIGLESTIVDLRDPQRPVILRPGAITLADIRSVLRRTTARRHTVPKAAPSAGQVAPGLLARHYSPRTPVVLHDRISQAQVTALSDGREAWIFLRRPRTAKKIAPHIFWFDDRGALAGVARQLFATLRTIDAKKFRRIHVELAPDRGIGRAINDRLRRAAAR